jgi:hypothetical protein
MNLKLLKEIDALNEDHEKMMTKEEMKTYLELLYKKCDKGTKEKFNEYLAKKCNIDSDDVDLGKCSEHLCDNPDKCDEIIHHLENLSERVDENSIMHILSEITKKEDSDEV